MKLDLSAVPKGMEGAEDFIVGDIVSFRGMGPWGELLDEGKVLKIYQNGNVLIQCGDIKVKTPLENCELLRRQDS